MTTTGLSAGQTRRRSAMSRGAQLPSILLAAVDSGDAELLQPGTICPRSLQQLCGDRLFMGPGGGCEDADALDAVQMAWLRLPKTRTRCSSPSGWADG